MSREIFRVTTDIATLLYLHSFYTFLILTLSKITFFFKCKKNRPLYLIFKILIDVFLLCIYILAFKDDFSFHLNHLGKSYAVLGYPYVFDSSVLELKQVFQAVDLFVIDALANGQVCIEMKISNAAEIIGRV